ncbi:MAG: DNA-processing protein DprA, partial [Clostridia bacterium]|nr:DNA-processing protein DprA [Clostridia bacterium]
MKSKDTLYWIWLSEALGAGSSAFRRLISLYDTPFEIFRAEESELEQIPNLTERAKRALCDKSLERATEILDLCERENIGIITYDEDAYPRALREIQKPPMLLYYRGNLPDFNRRLCVSIVGTRSMSAYGLRQAYKMSYELATAGAVVVSGMAKGIDGVAAGAAIKAGGATVAVLGCGVDIAYPTHHKPLSIEIAKTGVVLSEYAPGTRPNSYHFPLRNRIISGLSQATVVVEAGIGSGSLITAKDAILQGREVFAIPANVGSKGADGTNGLLRDGAKMALSTDDVLAPYQYTYAESLTLEK